MESVCVLAREKGGERNRERERKRCTVPDVTE